MANFAFFKRMFLLLSIAFFAISCASKNYLTNRDLSAEYVLKSAEKNTPTLCEYRGRILVRLKNVKNYSFTALLDKNCDGVFSLTILGALNMPVAEIKHDGHDTSVSTTNEEVKTNLDPVARAYSRLIEQYVKSPLPFPKTSYKFSIEPEEYLFSFIHNFELGINPELKFSKYVMNTRTVSYSWQNSVIKDIVIDDSQETIEIRFLNHSGWVLKDE